MLRITQNVTQKLVSNLKDAFDIFYEHRVAEYPSYQRTIFPVS